MLVHFLRKYWKQQFCFMYLKDPVQPGLFYKHLRHSLIQSLALFLQTFKTSVHLNRKSQGAEIFRECSPLSMCQVSSVRCQVSILLLFFNILSLKLLFCTCMDIIQKQPQYLIQSNFSYILFQTLPGLKQYSQKTKTKTEHCLEEDKNYLAQEKLNFMKRKLRNSKGRAIRFDQIRLDKDQIQVSVGSLEVGEHSREDCMM